jgi:SAM-dependent methyltransferase
MVMRAMTQLINQEQIEFWNGPRALAWVAEQEARDRALAPFGEAALKRATVAPGERVVDVGCGCGTTTMELSDAVGPDGAVLGLDVSGPMLARAKERATGRPRIRFELGDAATFDFSAAGLSEHTLLFSRFGVMFFEQPAQAFANLRRSLRPGGRVAFVCWRRLEDNPWMAIPFAAAKTVLSPPPPAGDKPGPLAFANADRVSGLLQEAGFLDATFEPFDHPMPLGDGQGIEAAAKEAISMGPTGRMLLDADEPTRARVLEAVRTALTPLARGDDVSLMAGAWIVTLRRGRSKHASEA